MVSSRSGSSGPIHTVGVAVAPAAQRVVDVAPDALGGLGAAAVALEAVEVDAERLAARPQVRVLEAALVGVQRVGELPEPALRWPAASDACASATARGCLALSAKWRNVRRTGAGLSRAVGRPRTSGRRSRRRTGPGGRRRGRGRGRPRAGPGRRRCAGRSSRVKRTDVARMTMLAGHPCPAPRAAAGGPARGRVPVLRRRAEPRGDHAAAAAVPAADARPGRHGRRHVPAVRAAHPRRPGAVGHADPGMGAAGPVRRRPGPRAVPAVAPHARR